MSFDYHDFIKVGEGHDKLVQKFEYLQSIGLKEYETEALTLLGLKKFPTRNDINIIEQIIPDTLDDWNDKENSQCYYIANLVCFTRIMKAMFNNAFVEEFKQYKPKDKEDLIIQNYHWLLEHLLLDSIYLLAVYDRVFLKRRSKYTIAKSEGKHPVTIYWSLKQLIFGQCSLLGHVRLSTDAAIPLIRQVIELRLRRAFGIFHLIREPDKHLEKISMTQIFNILNAYKDKIEFAVPLHTIRRIYSWSNIFVHAGMRDFVWKPIKVAAFLEKLVSGEWSKSGYDVDNGIILSRGILEKIRQDASKLKGEGFRLIGCEPEVVII